MKSSLLLITAIFCLGVNVSAHADILELKNGSILNGKYGGGTAGTVRFDVGAGMQVFESSQIMTLTFTTPTGTIVPPTPIPPTPIPPTSAPAVAPSTVTLPYGTTLLVRMMDTISSRNAAGANFSTKLEYDLGVNGVVAVPAGTTIYGKVKSSTQARRALGRSTLDIRLSQIVIGGSPVAIVTSGFQEAGQASIAKAAKGAAFGAAVGGIAGDAGKGAAIGATASLVKKGDTVTVPAGTLLEFTLTQPVSVQVGQ
jgi:hypothetical protein